MAKVQAAMEFGPEHGAGKEASVRALDRLIDQELLVQAAEREHLERDPQVRRALEEARRQVLAQSYVDRSVAGAGDGASDEVHDYYEQNPALFGQRRIYRFRELAVEGPSEKLSTLMQVARSSRSLDELAAWLRARRLPFSVASATKPAEQLPLNFLPRLAEMKDGDRAVFPTPSGASIVHLIESQEAGLSEAQAAPVIERFLASRRRLQTADEAIARLRAAAVIEYRGGFRTGGHDVALRAAAAPGVEPAFAAAVPALTPASAATLAR
jgi:EpsD family peptidyl-prolyl cis-trans isomerase